jgi:hypothetical protein
VQFLYMVRSHGAIITCVERGTKVGEVKVQ